MIGHRPLADLLALPPGLAKQDSGLRFPVRHDVGMLSNPTGQRKYNSILLHGSAFVTCQVELLHRICEGESLARPCGGGGGDDEEAGASRPSLGPGPSGAAADAGNDRARILDPDSQLATTRSLDPDMLANSLGLALGIERVEVDELYGAMDWLGRGQARIEKKLAAKRLEEGELVLWDATTVRFDSQTSELAQFGRPKGGGRSERRLVFGLLTTREGVPVAVEVFAGNSAIEKPVPEVLVAMAVQALAGNKRTRAERSAAS